MGLPTLPQGTGGLPIVRNVTYTPNSNIIGIQSIIIPVTTEMDTEKSLVLLGHVGNQLFEDDPRVDDYAVRGPQIQIFDKDNIRMRGHWGLNNGDSMTFQMWEFPMRRRVYQDQATFTMNEEWRRTNITPEGGPYDEGSLVFINSVGDVRDNPDQEEFRAYPETMIKSDGTFDLISWLSTGAGSQEVTLFFQIIAI
jgi:hypothetical protein